MYLECIHENLKAFLPSELFTYAATKGLPELRKLWLDKMLKQNPSLAGKSLSMPVVTNALTHGLSIVADLFCSEGDYVVTPDKFWGNYRMIFAVRRGGNIVTFNTFADDCYNVDGFLKKIGECGKLKPKVLVLLNFSNNPTGYTLVESEADKLVNGLKEIADSGVELVCIVDDAYFGMFYGDCIRESLFSRLAGISPNILAVKLDGATKEMFVWGLRVGFITFALPFGAKEQLLDALEEKVEGDIRATISSCANPSQNMILKALKHRDMDSQIAKNIDILKERAFAAMKVVADPKYRDRFTVYPFNSGYFMCLKLNNVDAEKLRIYLLDNYGVGTIAQSSTDLRIAFSCIDKEDFAELYDIIYEAIGKVAAS
jgi:aspartate/methionine/tyrosine aminotransferase